jgi:biopolymer transport protein ExbD
MKTKDAQKVHLESGPNMTPLVDVVMVILIFLMPAGGFGGAEHYLVSKLPMQDEGGPADPTAPRPFDNQQLDIRVDGSAAVDSPNRWTARFGNVTTADPVELSRGLKEKRDQYNSGGMPTDQLQVIINPNGLVKWQSLVQVYQAAMDAGYTKIAFSKTH